ncbi:DUF3290 family protein [Veillonella sp.]|uniref:DUF3290 family protein n=1 Tax=Veillonella sp. TaxID=1926307 RepID=UPI0025843CB6|nr:DUF3290 family protein [Veillonella sp.]MDU4573514.1 DUF3290 family protein [Veillonella sp.]
MDFYTLSYVESLAVGGQTWGFIILVTVLLALLVLGVQVLRNGLTSRYRDLMVILLLIVVFFLGLEYQEYNRMKTYSEDSSRMAQFLHSFSTEQPVPSAQLAVNSLKIRNGMILKVNDIYYEVQFNPEFSTYTITRVYKVSPTDRIHDKADVLP